MPSIVTNEFKIYNADRFAESLTGNANSKVYMFIGRPYSWSNDSSPPTPNVNPNSSYEYWDDMMAMRRINSSDVKNVIPRNNWTTGTVYTEFDNISNLFDTDFYVVTSQYKVYKCIFNNNGGQSTIEPTSTTTNVFTTADGYRWKYMYSLAETDVLKFLTTNYMAVNTDSSVSSAAIDGGIHNVKLVSGGSGYSNLGNLIVTVTGDGANANVTANIVLGAIDKFIINDPGFDYRYANILVSGGGGTGASGRAIISPNGGHGYDPKSELGGYYIMVNGRFNYSYGNEDFPVVNDYRRIGLIRDPISRYTNQIATEVSLNTNYTMNVSVSSGTFTIDEFITGANTSANAKLVVANVSGGFGYFRYFQANGVTSNYTDFAVGESITGTSSGAIASINSIRQPEAVHDSGKIIYVLNRTPITRRFNQAENVHIVVEF